MHTLLKWAIMRSLAVAGASGLIALSGIAYAQFPTASFEAISTFRSVVTVNLDNSVSVKETIAYDTGPQARHGIYRDIYPYSSEGRLMDIKDIIVTDDRGNPYSWQRLSNGADVRIKIGDPNVTFTGPRVYMLNYTATNAVAHLNDIDEIYWNATGNDWLIPVYGAQTTIYLPQGVSVTQSACYYGPKGAASQCQGSSSPAYYFVSPQVLAPGEGLTVAVGFSKGTIPPYSTVDNASNLFHRSIGLIIAGLLPLIVFVTMFMRWRKVGRDPKDHRSIIPEYDVPDGLTPLEVSRILYPKMSSGDISAEIIYLATKGYIKVRRIENKMLGFIKTIDYEFEIVKDISGLDNGFDLALIQGVFRIVTDVGTKARLSDLKNSFYKSIPGISDVVVDSMLTKGYYSNLKKSNHFASGQFSLILLLRIGLPFIVAFGITGLGNMGQVFASSNILWYAGSVALSIAIFGMFEHLMPARTEKGVLTKDYILGLKLYLQIAEKDRLQFHNAPEKKPETFEKLLPYAMVLGVNEAWAKEFEGIVTEPPSWYEGYPIGTGVFSPVSFNSSLLSFGSAATSSMGSSPGGGSGGGGFSGGGGGGGGGGGW